MRIFGPGSAGGGGGSGAPVGAQYVTLATHADLTAERVLTAPAAGITLVDSGANGTVTITLANDLAALEALTSVDGMLVRSAAETYVARTLTGPAAGITVSNGGGAAGNPTLALANDLSGLEGLTGTGSAVPMRTAADTWTTMQLTPQPPQGRLTPTSATPVVIADTPNFTTFYYALYEGDLIPIYDGTSWTSTRFTELSIAMAASANWAASSVYDVYVINDAGTLRLATGTAWTNDTTRSVDTIVRVNGIWLNSTTHTMRYGAASTVSVTAQRGTYVGSIRTTASAGTSTWEIGGIAANGDAGFLYLWNTYNRVPVSVMSIDNVDSWVYDSATIRSKNNSTANRITALRGLNEDGVLVACVGLGRHSASVGTGSIGTGIGFDATTAITGTGLTNETAASATIANIAHYADVPGLGLHFWQALEHSQATGTATFFGDAGAPTKFQSGISYTGMH